MSLSPAEMEHTRAHLVLERLCTSLTHALQEFLQGHTATIEGYVAQAHTPTNRGPEAAHTALAQEIAHVAHFVETLQTNLTAVLEDFPQFDNKRVPPPRGEPEAE